MSKKVDRQLDQVLDGVETASFVQDSEPFESRLMETIHMRLRMHRAANMEARPRIPSLGSKSVGRSLGKALPVPSGAVTIVEKWRSAQMATRLVFWKRLARRSSTQEVQDVLNDRKRRLVRHRRSFPGTVSLNEVCMVVRTFR